MDAFVTKLNPAGSALVYSTYLGGSGLEGSSGIAVDASGTAYVVGATASSNFPTVTPLQGTFGGGTWDMFVARINSTGSALVFSTYLGGSGDELGPGFIGLVSGIAVDSAGNAYLTGSTSSNDFPKANALQPIIRGGLDVFVTRLNSTGTTLVYSTYLGGSDDDYGQAVALDPSGNAYVTGLTFSTNFPTANPWQSASRGSGDAFVTKINAAGSTRVYSTYLGGTGTEEGRGIAVDSSGNAHVTGITDSTNFPVSNAFQPNAAGGDSDAFVTKLNSGGSALLYSTYLGGTGSDFGHGIALDLSNNAYVIGQTNSTGFPVSNAIQAARAGSRDAFVAMLNPVGSTLLYSTYLGGVSWESGLGIAVDSAGDAYVTGETESTDFPTASPFQSSFRGGTCGTPPNTFPCDDIFITKISNSATGSLTPRMTLISPVSAAAGSAGFTLTANGSNFVTGSVVRWNGADRPTLFVNNNLLEATISSSDIATAGTAQVTVFNPPPGGGTSNALPFTVIGPLISPNGVLNNASYNLASLAVAPGTIVAIFGTRLTDGTSCLPPSCNPTFGSDGRLNTTMAGARVTVNGTSPQNPARPGEVVILYATGLGEVTPSVPTGVLPTGASATVNPATVTIDGVAVTPDYAGLAGCCVGLNQINLQIPSTTRTANDIAVVVSIGGKQSNAVTIAVQNQ